MEKENKVINEILETFENKAAELPPCARALQLYNDRKYDEAVKLWEECAKKDDAEALFWLANCFMQELAGRELSEEERIKQGFEYALKSAELGFDKGQQYVAVLYYNGAGTERNFKAALEWAKKAADGGLVQAMNTVGYLYEYGDYIEDTAEDKSKAAFNWYMKAAQNGNAAGQCNVGRCFAEGLGVARDKQEAVTWYTRACLLYFV